MDTPFGAEGPLTATTPVVVVAAPAASAQKIILADGVAVYNADTVAHVVTITKKKTAGSVACVLYSGSIAAGAVYVLAKRIVLDDTDETLEIVSDAVATTTEPDYDVAGMLCEAPA